MAPKTWSLFVEMFRLYPLRGVVVVCALIVAGLAEGVSIATLLPLLSLTMQGAGEVTAVGKFVGQIFAVLGTKPDIAVLLLLIFAGICVKAAATLFALSLAATAYAMVAADLRLSLLDNLMRANWPYFSAKPVGTFGNAIGLEARNASALYSAVARFVAAFLLIPVYLTIAFAISWQVTISAIIAGLLLVAALSLLVRMARVAGQRQVHYYEIIVNQIGDLLTSIKPLKAMALQQNIVRLLEDDTRALSRAQRMGLMAGSYNRTLQEPIVVFFLLGGIFLCLTVGAFTLDTLLVLGIAFYRCVNQIAAMQGQYQTLAANERFYFSLRDKISEAGAARETFDGTTKVRFSESIKLSGININFGQNKVLHNVDLVVPFGKTTVLIGPSGAGKTTLVDIILGLFKPDQGSVVVDGIDLNDMDLHAWRSTVGYVPQDTILLNDSIRQNIVLGDDDVTDGDVWTALRAAGAEAFVRDKPEGLDTSVGEHGNQLSGGQRQRIAIARAMLRSPRLLILDEATASLDPATEQEICQMIKRLGNDLAVLAITHRPAMLDIADCVYRVEEGRAEPAATADHAPLFEHGHIAKPGAKPANGGT